MLSKTPDVLLHLVQPLPLSLATTHRISVDFFSSPYLDVSVQAVPLIYLFYSVYDAQTFSMRIAPFGYLRINVCLQLPAAFRSLPRPSSAPDAKAFSLRSYQLDHFELCSHLLLKAFTKNFCFSLIVVKIPDFFVVYFPHLHLPFPLFNFQVAISEAFFASMVGTSGLEPPTSRLSGVRSNLLSYEPSSLPGSRFSTTFF